MVAGTLAMGSVIGAGAVAGGPARSAVAAGPQPYPVGTAFPVGWYAIRPEFFDAERDNGATIAHIYAPVDVPTAVDYLAEVDDADLTALCRLPLASTTEPKQMPPLATAVAAITDRASAPVAWWDLPEEMRYWYANEMAVVTDYVALTRQHDPQQRPNHMYLPNHYRASAFAEYVPHLDILPVSAYRSYAAMEPAWIRWRMQQMHQAVDSVSATLGPDHLAGEKTITAALELFASAGKPVMTAADARHDFWAALTGGAKGIMIYSWAHRTDDPLLAAALDSYHDCIDTLLNTPGLASALLFGEVVSVATGLVSGPAQAAPFQPYGVDAPITLPSYDVRVVEHQGHQYALVTNSATSPVTVEVSGLEPVTGDGGVVTVTVPALDVAIVSR